MIGINHLGVPYDSDGKISYSVFTGDNNKWQVWQKPLDCSTVHIFMLGSGGGGAGGSKTSGAFPVQGGSGGGSAASTTMIIPAFFLPDTLYVISPSGSSGGAGRSSTGTGLSGADGGIAYVSAVAGSTNAYDVICQSGTPATPARGATNSAAGSGGTAWTPTGPLTLNCLYLTSAGTAGVTSTVVGNQPSVTVSSITSGGAPGGCVDTAGTGFSGGNITGAGLEPTILGGIVGTSVRGGSGYSSIQNSSSLLTDTSPLTSLVFTGGAGGPRGGDAGFGAYGCGGGGGGASSSTVFLSTSGAGGNGGPGLVIITAW